LDWALFHEPVAPAIPTPAVSALSRLAKDLAHFALVAGALPFTLAEAALGAGSTVIMEARPR